MALGGTPILRGAVGGIIVAAYVERFMRKVTPDVIALIVVPTVTVLVAGSVDLGVLMSVDGVVAVAIGTAGTCLLGSGDTFASFISARFTCRSSGQACTSGSSRSTPS